MGEVMKRDGGLVEAMGGCRPPTPAPAGWARPLLCHTRETGGPRPPNAGEGTRLAHLFLSALDPVEDLGLHRPAPCTLHATLCANMAHVGQSRPVAGHGYQVMVLKIVQGVPFKSFGLLPLGSKAKIASLRRSPRLARERRSPRLEKERERERERDLGGDVPPPPPEEGTLAVLRGKKSARECERKRLK